MIMDYDSYCIHLTKTCFCLDEDDVLVNVHMYFATEQDSSV